jgi:hypothetical protein
MVKLLYMRKEVLRILSNPPDKESGQDLFTPGATKISSLRDLDSYPGVTNLPGGRQAVFMK